MEDSYVSGTFFENSIEELIVNYSIHNNGGEFIFPKGD